MSVIYTDVETFITRVCGECGITFGVPEMFDKENRKTGNIWHCPNGHERIYRESDTTKLKRELSRERARHDQTQAELNHTKKTLIAEKGHRTRLKKRIANGVCPCCNRSFQNVHKHIKNKHPDYVK